MAATTVMTVSAIVAAVAATGTAVVEGVQNYQANKYAKAEAEINEAQAEQARKQAYQEESLNATQHSRAGRHDLARGANLMAAAGNIGTSAQSAYFGGAFNLAEDLSALKYKYDAEAAKYGTQAKMYGQHAKMADYNKRMGLLASSLKTTGTASKGVYNVMGSMGYGTNKTD